MHDPRGQIGELPPSAILHRSGRSGRQPDGLDRVVGTLSELAGGPLVVLDGQGRVRHASPSALRAFGLDRDEVVGRPLEALHSGGWCGPGLRELLARVLGLGESVDGFAVALEVPGLGRRAFRVRARRLDRVGGRRALAVLSFAEVPEAGAGEDRFRLVADATYDWESWIDPAGRLLWVNPAVERIAGVRAEDCLTMDDYPLPLIHPGDRGRIAALLERARAGASGNDVEFRVVRPDGSTCWAAISWQPMSDRDGAPLGLRASVRDIGDRKRAEDALRAERDALEARVAARTAALEQANEALRRAEAEQAEWRSRYESAVGAARLVLYDSDYRTGDVTYGGAAEEVLGYRPDELAGGLDAWARLIHPDDRDAFLDLVSRPDPAAGPFRLDYRIRHKDGRDLVVRDEGRYVPIPGGGMRAIGFVADVTEAARVQEALRASECRFRAVFDQTFQLAGILSPDGTMLEINRTALEFCGLAPDEAIGRPFWEIRCWSETPGAPDRLRAAIARAAAGAAVCYEEGIVNAEGSTSVLEVSIKPVFDEAGAVALLIPEGRDVTDRKRTERELAEALREHREITETVPDILYVLDLRGNLRQWNRKLEATTGLTPEQLLDRPAEEFFPPEDREAVREAIGRALQEGYAEVQARLILADGTTVPHHYTAGPLRDASGAVVGLTGVGRDITERLAIEATLRKQAEAIRESERRFRLLVENAADAFFLTDADLRILDANNRACESLGYARDELLERDLSEFEVLATRGAILEFLGRIAPGEAVTIEGTHLRRDGATFPVEVRVTALDSGGRRLFLALARDVTDRKRAAADLEHQATHDALTGLPNRACFQARSAAAVAEAAARGGRAAMLLIDLDGFKEVNDTFGHHYGDAVLQVVSPRLRAGLRPTDLVARLGGDEFAILLPGAGRDTAVGVAERTLRQICGPIEVEGHRLGVGASVGLALFPEHGADASGLLQCADAAMYEAKRSRSGYALFDPRRSHGDPRRLALAADLRRAVEDGQLLLHYQPQFDLKTGRLRGCEALARWLHPADGLIPPGQFIPLAEQTGLIRPLGAWALDAAIRQCVDWHEAGFEPGVAVNLAPDNLQDRDLPAVVGALLRRTGARPGWLTVEVTESAMMAYPDRAKAALKALHDQGLRISIDDFGTGYSSLGYLKDLPADEVKVDRAFVAEILRDERAAFITRAVIDLGHRLGLEVVAEGVEDRQTESLLAEWGCDTAQGYLYGQAVPASTFRDRFGRASRRPHPGRR